MKSAASRTALLRDIDRGFIALWYLLGWISHVYLGLFSPGLYRGFGDTALIPGFTAFWRGVIMPAIPFFAVLLAAFEISVGVLLVSKGRWVKIGLAFSILFNLFLVQMGLSYRTPDPWSGFLVNRLPNLIFIALQIPLFWGRFDRFLFSRAATTPEVSQADHRP
jgi:hypothetical protein